MQCTWSGFTILMNPECIFNYYDTAKDIPSFSTGSLRSKKLIPILDQVITGAGIPVTIQSINTGSF